MPPLANNRKSPGRGCSPSSPEDHSTLLWVQQQQQQQQAQMHGGYTSAFAGCSSGIAAVSVAPGDASACGHSLLSPAGSAQLRGQFQALTVTSSSYEDTGAGMGAAAMAAQHQQASHDGQALLGKTGSCQSVAGVDDEASVDRELEELLAQVAGWPGEAATAAAGAGGGGGMQTSHMPSVVAGAMPQAPAANAASPAVAAASQQHPIRSCAASAPVHAGAASASDQQPSLQGELAPSSLNWWAAAGSLELPDDCPGLCDSTLLDELLANNSEEACLVDLLLE